MGVVKILVGAAIVGAFIAAIVMATKKEGFSTGSDWWVWLIVAGVAVVIGLFLFGKI